MKITKCEVITAIMSEPLKGGTWMNEQWWDEQLDYANSKKCTVCAVGSVLRNRVDPAMSVADFNAVCGRAAYGADRRPLGRLSNVFERLCGEQDENPRRMTWTKIRYKTASWAAEKLAERFKVDVHEDYDV